ncbi:MAG: phenylalanine--tRNA ligase subunit beta, partial [Chloroflexi bacterium]|nr:phenylalanine--tRNA ligase subunit beta [Chloroflexota bacterium]
VLDIKVTPNRPDCLSVLGVAREVAALTGKEVRAPRIDYPESEPVIEAVARVRVDDQDLCPRYTASVIRGVKVGPSPQWLIDRLKLIGQNPINNVVDITNYVMFEFGQPLHAFDLRQVRDGTVVVRRAHPGEDLLTLDGVERKLTDDMLVIADTERAIGLAGVIGGLRSGVNADTADILLESATFNGTNNRRTASGLGLRTEATLRFEKGLRPELSEMALRRATGLIAQICGGRVPRGWIDVWPGRAAHDPSVTVTRKKLFQILGVDYSESQVEATLRSLGCSLVPIADGWKVTPPYWRADITIPEDVAEELARVIGYDTIPTKRLSGEPPRWEPNINRDIRERVRDVLAGLGLQEIISYPLTTVESIAKVRPPAAPAPLRVANPMSADYAVLRTTLREAVLRTLTRNSYTWRGPVAVFECGRVYLDMGEGLPEEREMVVGALLGPRTTPHWSAGEQSGGEQRFDYYDAKGAVEAILAGFGLAGTFAATADSTFASGHCAAVAAGDIGLGVLGEVSTDVLIAIGCEIGPVALFELDLDGLSEVPGIKAPWQRQYRPFGRYPESVRDLSVIIDDSTEAVRLLARARQNRLVVDGTVFDVYRGEGLPRGKKALGLRLVYQSLERTLTTTEIEKAESSILRELEREFGAVLRT